MRFLSIVFQYSEENGFFGGIFPNQYSFGELMHEFDFSAAWVNAVAWAPGMKRIAFAAHNSTVSIAELNPNGVPTLQTLRLPGLPFTAVTFLSDNTLVGVGYDCAPFAFSFNGSSWAFVERIDKEKKVESKAVSSGIAGARAMFQGASSQGFAIKDNAQKVEEKGLKTRHQNVITYTCWLVYD